MAATGLRMTRVVLFIVLYLLGAYLADQFIHAPGQVALFWPASGLAIGFLVRYGLRWVLPLAVSILLMHLLISPVPTTFLLFSVASNVIGGSLAAIYVRRKALPSFISVHGGFVLLRGGIIMATVSALIGTAGLYVADMVTADMLWPTFAKWGMGDLLGIISVGPTVFLLTTGPSSNPDQPLNSEYARLREKIIWSILLFSTYALVFLGGTSGSNYALGLSALPIALIIWSAIRFQPIWTTGGITLTILILTSMTGFGMAGFKPPDVLIDAALLLIFLCLISTIPLVLVAANHENRVATRKLIRRATTDSATGLANRTAFEEATREALSRNGLPQTLAYLDLDHFTLVNDTASHAAGDELLQGIASLLVSTLHAGDRLFRIGGDEFALLLLCEGKEAELRCQRILHDIEAFRIGWESQVISTTASIGITTLRPSQSDFAGLLSQADAACFTAKELGGNRVFISSQTETQSQDRTEAMRWAVRIRDALNQNLFELDCQSIISLKNPSERGRYFEVLVRMRDPVTQQRLLPGYFIPAAERFHLGTQIDRHVVELVLNWMEKHPDAAETVSGCSINLTAASMVDEGFSQFLKTRILTSSFSARKIIFEITETSAVRDLSRAQNLINDMRALGCRFALDDFGTGFCSFNYLRNLDVDYFKIDGSFVRDLQSSSLSTAVIKSITDIAHVLNKKTTAEHCESEALAEILLSLNVDYAQGFGIHKPEPIDEYFSVTNTKLAQ